MKDNLADKWMTIDEVAKKAGKFVAGASGNGYIRPARGFGIAWDQFVNHIEKGLGLKGADIMEKGLSFVTPKKDQPWFLYLGLIDTHVTWRAKQPWMDKYDGGYKGRFATEYGDDGPNGSNGKDLTEKEKEHVRALYDSNVSYQDDLLGQLVEKLKSWGIWDQTMLDRHGRSRRRAVGRRSRRSRRQRARDAAPRAAARSTTRRCSRRARSPRAPRASTSCRRSPTRSASRPTPSGRAPRWSRSRTAPAATR